MILVLLLAILWELKVGQLGSECQGWKINTDGANN